MHVEFGPVEKALNSLKQALANPPQNDLERDGVIQRFEYSFELTWKTAKRALAKTGINAESPRAVIRELAQQGFIADAELWMLLPDARNYTSQTYNESTAQWVFSQAARFLSESEILMERLKAETRK
jgi:nucleotidyltransferase substrate binding protein (TIGR01987 family)